MSAVAAPRPMPARSAAAPDAVLASPAVVRVATAAAVALFGALHWANLLEPAARGRMLLCTLVVVAAAVVAVTIRGRSVGARLAAASVAVVAALLLLPLARVPGRLFAPAQWDALVSGIAQGVQTIPGIGVPYRGVDPWVRIDLVLAGGVLLLIGMLLAVHALRRGARPVAAAAVLTVVYAVPVVEHTPRHPYAGGMAFAVLLGALLWADRVERRHAAPALVFALVAALGGLLAAPRLDGSRAWLDYERIAGKLTDPPSTRFTWTHSYGSLDWPRDGRELLRVATRKPVYFKAADLDGFDGVRWRSERLVPPQRDTQVSINHPDWRQRLRVTVRNLRSPEYIGAGTVLGIQHSPRTIFNGPPGTFVTGRDSQLRRGDSYQADVYAPRPTVLEMAAAGADYPTFASAYLTMDLPASVGGPGGTADAPSTLAAVQVQFQGFGVDIPPVAIAPGVGPSGTDATALLEASAYAPAYALAQRIKGRAGTPYQFVRAVQQYLATGFAYAESVPAPKAGRPPLVSFLFDEKVGFCQQFSGSMALLLRMGGIPTRIASGFTPGTYDSARREWVVRDYDAHSWVEAYFPGIGWVPFDPTPPAAPPRSQLAGGPTPEGATPAPAQQEAGRADVPRGGGPQSLGKGADVPLGVLVLAGVLVLLIGGAAVALVARLRRRPRSVVAPELAELDRALRRTGRPPLPPLTLRALELRWLHQAPQAAAYVEAVRLARYAGADNGPTRGQRAALREELAEGLGALGRVRAWWAVPPSWAGPGRRDAPYTGR